MILKTHQVDVLETLIIAIIVAPPWLLIAQEISYNLWFFSFKTLNQVLVL
jgi:hypothetical protein